MLNASSRRQRTLIEGVAQLDEAMLLAVDGRLHSPILKGVVYCNLISTAAKSMRSAARE